MAWTETSAPAGLDGDAAQEAWLRAALAPERYRAPDGKDEACLRFRAALLAKLRRSMREDFLFRELLRPAANSPKSAMLEDALLGQDAGSVPRPSFRISAYLRLRGHLLRKKDGASASPAAPAPNASGQSAPKSRWGQKRRVMMAALAAAAAACAVWTLHSWDNQGQGRGGMAAPFKGGIALQPVAMPVPVPLRPGRVFMRHVEYQACPGAAWAVIAQAEDMPVAPGARWRVPEDATSDIPHGFGTPGQETLVFLQPGAEIALDAAGVSLERGMASVKNSVPFALLVDGKTVLAEPGSRLVAMMVDPSGFAPGGAPAPRLFLDGESLAFLRVGADMAPLYPGHEYRIDRYVSPDVAGTPMAHTAPTQADFGLWPPALPSSAPAFGLVAGWSSAAAPAIGNDALEAGGYRRDKGRWLPPDYQGQPAAEIRRNSVDYFTFLRQHRDLAPVLSTREPVIVQAEETFYLIQP